MSGKFRPPLLKKVEKQISQRDPDHDDLEPPRTKKRRISADDQEQDPKSTGPQLVFRKSGISFLPRKPLITVKNPAVAALPPPPPPPLEGGVEGYYNVLWRKYTTKKHKTWDGDGILRVVGGYAHLQDISGRDMGRITCNEPLLPGSPLSIGGKEIEVDSILSKEDYLAGRPFLRTSTTDSGLAVKRIPLPKPTPKSESRTIRLGKKEEDKRPPHVAAPRSLSTQTSFKNPLLASTVMPKMEAKEPTPRHDPSADGALIMKRPKNVPKGKQIVDVVVDPLLTKTLRDHQREGVMFLYECIMGMRGFEGRGAILADEMGLGKTLQTIALIWTLLKQNPIGGDHPVIKKALIVCPVTLINNWRKEFRKWLGADRLGVYIFDDSKKRITDFTKGRAYSVMIIGYEKLRTVCEELKKGDSIDIVVADEGHRLKSAKNKSALAIKSLDTPRRVILSGTPIQNDLSEFYTMVDFVNPDLLGSVKTFTKEFEVPIVKSRQPGSLTKDIEKGEARSEELASLTSTFILRRTADILAKYLPPKTEYVLFCRPTNAQASIYQHVLANPAFQCALGNPEASLQIITVLKKVSNSPSLLGPKVRNEDAMPGSPLTADILGSVPPQLLRNNQASTKLRTLDQLLHTLRTTTSEKIVLVSNYTSTLDLLENLLTSLAHPYLRLDGSTPSAKRQDLVDAFNGSPASQCYAFLLSAKAGGLGLNLVGASRLVLFDVDWNPATDLQAMARIHREGQKRPCVIYRLLMAGGLDEKIWQRQVTKLGLASNIMDQKMGPASFSREELRDLFRLDEGLSCQTHDLLGCECRGRGLPELCVEEEQPSTEILDSETEAYGENEEETEDDHLPDIPQLIQANKVNMEEQERHIEEAKRAFSRRSCKDGNDDDDDDDDDDVSIKKKKKKKKKTKGNKNKENTSTKKKKRKKKEMGSLMAYSHIDTSKFATEESDEDVEALIGDQVLLNVLKEEGNRVSFVFKKTSGAQ